MLLAILNLEDSLSLEAVKISVAPVVSLAHKHTVKRKPEVSDS